MKRWWWRLVLFCQIVGRRWDEGARIRPGTAWAVARIVWGKEQHAAGDAR